MKKLLFALLPLLFAPLCFGQVQIQGNTVVMGGPTVTGCSTSGCTMTGTLNGTSVNGSVNQVVNMCTAPYNGACNGTTDDTAAYQAAVTALGTTGGEILIPKNVYLANPSSITYPAYSSGFLKVVIQGNLIGGSTFKFPTNVDPEGSFGFAPSFFGSGAVGKITGPNITGTLGTAVTAGSNVTFTPSSMNGLYVGTVITVVSMTNCSLSLTRTTASTFNVTATVSSGTCHIAPGYNVTISGASDSSFNGTFLVAASDYVQNTLTWTQTGAASTATATGVGVNEDSIESTDITAVTGTTATVRAFVVSHASTDTFGVGAAYFTGGGHSIKNLNISSPSGLGVWWFNAVDIQIDNAHVIETPCNTCGVMEMNESYWGWIRNSVLSNWNGYGSWGLRYTTQSFSYPGGAGFEWIQNTVVGGGIKVDRIDNNGGGNIYLNGVICEQSTRGCIAVDRSTNPTAGMYRFSFIDSQMQDENNFSGNCMVNYLYPANAGNGTITIDGWSNNLAACTTGPYTNVEPKVDSTTQAPTFGGSTGQGFTYTQGGITETNLRSIGANLSPAILPHATQNVPQVGSWVTGSSCSVNTGVQSPSGLTNAVSLSPVSGSGTYYFYGGSGNVQITPSVGDIIMFGGWVRSDPSAGSAARDTTGPGGNYVLSLSNVTLGGAISTNAYDLLLPGDWWHSVVGFTTVTAVQAGTHYLEMGADCGTPLLDYYNPWLIWIKAADNVPYSEAVRWKQNLLHAYVAPNTAAGTLSTDPSLTAALGPVTATSVNGLGTFGLQTNGTDVTPTNNKVNFVGAGGLSVGQSGNQITLTQGASGGGPFATITGTTSGITYAAGVGAGTSPTLTCPASGYELTTLAGTCSLVVGTSPTTGVALTVTLPTHTYNLNCYRYAWDSGTGSVLTLTVPTASTSVVSFQWASGTLTAAHTYLFQYHCIGQ